jgi:hypothetical protein
VKSELITRDTEIARQLIASEGNRTPDAPERRLPGFTPNTNIQVNVSSPAGTTVQAMETPAPLEGAGESS